MWRYIVRSAIGVAHQQLGLPCQDNAGCFVKENCLIGVVADGAGSAKFAEIGSQSLVKTTLEFINEHDLHFSNKSTIWQLLTQILPNCLKCGKRNSLINMFKLF